MSKRKSYSRITQVMDLPDLLEIQTSSYEEFLQPDVPPRLRKKQGLHEAFLKLFPISDQKQYYKLEYEGYKLGVPKYSIRECKERGITFAAPLLVDLSLSVFEPDGETQRFIEKISNEVYLGELPLMTERGTFVINGAERVIVSQLHRSPGITIDMEEDSNGKKTYTCRIIPQRGSWLELVVENNNTLSVNIDRHRKMPVTVLLRALGLGTMQQMLSAFFEMERLEVKPKLRDVLKGAVMGEPVYNKETGEVIVDVLETIPENKLDDRIQKLTDAGITSVTVLKDVTGDPKNTILHTLVAEKDVKAGTGQIVDVTSEEASLKYVYQNQRPGEPPNTEAARSYVHGLFFSEKRYDLSSVGRHRLNTRLYNTSASSGRSGPAHGKQAPSEEQNTLTLDDLVLACRYMVGLDAGKGYVDDIDHLGNRRVRAVGELLAAQFTVGLTRLQRTIRERLSTRDTESLTPQDLINARTVSTVIQAFFGSSQLSQFLDQTNPLAELTHKRRVSALGPGGLTRERAGFEVRDVHHTHYGRLCPIETPEGPNIGLIASLSTYARVNKFGFIETPYQKVTEGRLTGEVEWLSADREDNYQIAQANTPVDGRKNIVGPLVFARHRGDFPLVAPKDIAYVDISPMQMVSVAAGLIPFLEHDDANRALMGSNMQRQAVPLLQTEEPYIGTGLERRTALDSGCLVLARNAGEVARVDATRVVVRRDKHAEGGLLDLTEFDTYELTKYERSNQDTCINQKVCVNVGDKVHAGDVLADGHATKNGELALGRNVFVAFMPWRGYNFEDAIVVSEKLIAEDIFTSVHIEVFELEVRDTKRGPEELTREIPNVSEESVKNLDENGVVRVGTEIESNDILVGKVTPKGETELSPEERLLRAIFGEKAGDVRDSSLKAPPGLKGVVIDTRIYTRKDRDKRSKKRDKQRIDELKAEITSQIQEIEKVRAERLLDILAGTSTRTITHRHTGETIVPAGRKWTKALIAKIAWNAVAFENGLCDEGRKNAKAVELVYRGNDLIGKLEDKLDKEIDKVVRGDELKPGVLQLVKVYVAKKRKLSVGDKMAGRHGNKGVISRIVSPEDMPFMDDGTPVEVILNPLGVPSRMNVGQILETHMGWAAQRLGTRVGTPVFDGATYSDVLALLEEAKLPRSGKAVLRDGRTGEPFDQPVTVGTMYMMKLCHLVDDKMHARSIGPYSLVTQQPLGGKSQLGGQRFGEMEVWALEAYGAAYTLQQMLTVKSDDITGRSKTYEAIVKGENTPDPGLPEGFRVLVNEIKALALDFEVLYEEEE